MVRARGAAALVATAVLAACGAREQAPPPAVTAACKEVAGLLSRVSTRMRGASTSLAADTDPGACRAGVAGRGGGAVSAADSVRAWMAAIGWREDPRHAADGPDGTVFGMARGEVACVITAGWDGGDDADPTYVPSDTLWFEARCAPAVPSGGDDP